MSLQVSNNGIVQNLKLTCYNDARQLYELKIGDPGEETIEIPYVLNVDKSYLSKDFDIHYFIKFNLKEEDIYQVYESKIDKRIGWCFPVQSLVSDQHSYANNEHFLRYAFVAFHKILTDDNCDIFKNIPSIDGVESIDVTDFFSDRTAIIIIDKTTLAGITEFNINNYIPSLFSFGYSPLTKRNPNELSFEVPISNIRSKKIKINRYSTDVPGKDYINNILAQNVAYEKNPLFSFFCLYQIIELLLEEVFKYEQKALLIKIFKNRKELHATKTIMEDINREQSESKRLKLLFTKYMNTMPSDGDLRNACNLFLSKHKKDEGVIFKEYFYPIRNLLFHEHRSMVPNSEEDLKEVVSKYIELLPELLHNFLVPH